MQESERDFRKACLGCETDTDVGETTVLRAPSTSSSGGGANEDLGIEVAFAFVFVFGGITFSFEINLGNDCFRRMDGPGRILL
jgi:hypothetical protein